jgi:hypothetical protein
MTIDDIAIGDTIYRGMPNLLVGKVVGIDKVGGANTRPGVLLGVSHQEQAVRVRCEELSEFVKLRG